jgi:hypothetical protein
MPDDPKKRGNQDRERVSRQEHEPGCQKEKQKRERKSDDGGRNPGENES